MSVELAPCPFCGSKPETDSYEMVPYEHLNIQDSGGHWYYVFCPHCFAQGGENLTMEKAIEAWNMRYKAE